jgi:hypothetical protein
VDLSIPFLRKSCSAAAHHHVDGIPGRGGVRGVAVG